MSDYGDWRHVDTRPVSVADQLMGSGESVFEFENNNTGETRTVVAYDLDEAGRKIARGDWD